MDERHESLHLNTANDVSWQENLYFCGFDDDRHNGFAIHLKLIPADRQAQIRALVVVDELRYTVGIRTELSDELRYPQYRAVNTEPFRRWELTLDAVGRPTINTGGYMGLEVAAEDEHLEPVRAAITLSTSLQPIDWASVTSVTGAGNGHYDHAHTWTGTLSIGDHTAHTSGLGIRDHSWGPRQLGGVDRAVFAATVAPDLSEHRTGVAGSRDGRSFGFGFHASSTGVTAFPTPTVEVISGSLDDDHISQVRIINAGEDVVATTRTEILMPLLRDHYLSRNLIGVTTPSNGFSFFEVGKGLDDAAVARIRREGSALS